MGARRYPSGIEENGVAAAMIQNVCQMSKKAARISPPAKVWIDPTQAAETEN
jgi:hypothetical protein